MNLLTRNESKSHQESSLIIIIVSLHANEQDVYVYIPT